MAARSLGRIEKRALLLFFLLGVGLVALGVRLVQLQVVWAEDFQKLALNQRLRTVALPALRGEMRDRDDSLIAVNRELASIYATPYLVKDKERTARKLARLLGADAAGIRAKLQRDSGFVYLARMAPTDIGRQVKELKIEGVGVIPEAKRYYPGAALASQVIGFTGIDNQGLAGLELEYDKALGGKAGKLIVEKDPLGQTIPGGRMELSSPVNGSRLSLTLDRDIQYRAERSLADAALQHRAKWGTVIVMDVATGEIYAMATYPGFDPNQPRTQPADVYRNRPVTDLYEPGSTMKTVLAIAALEERKISASERFYLPSTIRVGNRTISESHGRAAKWFTFEDIIGESSNVGASTVALRLGKQALYKHIVRMRLVEQTHVDFPAEEAGSVSDPEEWPAVKLANVGFGQGIMVTPLGLLRAFAAIGNEGTAVRPHFVNKVGERFVGDPAPVRVMSPATARQMRALLQSAVEKGTGKPAASKEYTVAGKTGTAQKAVPGIRGYAPGKYVGSFIGIVPAERPKLAILVLLDEPAPVYYGGLVAGPVFKKIAEFSLVHLRVPPSGKKPAM